MGIMEGKKGIIFGVSNKFGIANAIAEQIYKEGGEIAFTYANEAMEKRVKPIADEMNSKMCVECDVTKDEDVKKTFEEYAKHYDKLDFVVHAVAFANKDDLMGEFYTTSKEGWDLAMHVSAYSLLTISKYVFCISSLVNMPYCLYFSSEKIPLLIAAFAISKAIFSPAFKLQFLLLNNNAVSSFHLQ